MCLCFVLMEKTTTNILLFCHVQEYTFKKVMFTEVKLINVKT